MQNNVAVLMNPQNPTAGAAACWDSPNTCIKTAESLMSQVRLLDYGGSSWLESVKYTIQSKPDSLYRIGDASNSWT